MHVNLLNETIKTCRFVRVNTSEGMSLNDKLFNIRIFVVCARVIFSYSSKKILNS